ncbi:MFS transporter [Chloroflexota bacterium]
MKKPSFFYGYAVVGSGFLIQAIGIGTIVAFGVFFKPILADLGWSRAVLSGAQSISLLIGGALGIVMGRLNDRFNPRLVMAITGLIFGLGHFLMSGISEIWYLYFVYGLVVGLGRSSVDVIPMTSAARWFRKKRGIMSGIIKVGTGIGQSLVPLLAILLISSFGWREAYQIIGVGAAILMVGAGQLLRRDPAGMGLLPDGVSSAPDTAKSSPETGTTLKEAMAGREFWTIGFANMAALFCLLIIMVHIVPHASDMGLDPALAAGVLSAIGGMSILGRVFIGLAVDRIGSRKAMIICFVLLVCVITSLQWIAAPWAFFTFAVVYGFAHGGLYTMISPIIAEYFGLRSHGTLFGIVAFSGNIGGAVGSVLAGYVFDTTGSYSLAFWGCTAILVVGLGLIISLGQPKPLPELASPSI